MIRTVRAALTETVNAYPHMPERLDDIHALADRLDDIRAANIAHHLELMADAKRLGVALIGFGELFTGPYFALTRDPMWFGLAEDARTGPTVSAFQEAAHDHAMVVVAPIYELDSATGLRFNTAVVIDEHGEVMGKYRKSHIPVGENEEGAFTETFYYQASDGQLGESFDNISANPYFPVFHTSRAKLGVATCYDRHFPRVMETLADNGAELVLSPAVTFGAKSRRMWDLEFPVDAARHNLFIGGSNRSGTEPPWHQPYFGASYFVGPNGRVPTIPSRPELVVADLCLDELTSPDPSGWNLARDRRPDIY